MTEQKSIAIIGGDMRLKHLADIIISKNISTYCYGVTPMYQKAVIADHLYEALDNSTVIVCPIPISNDQEHINALENKEDLTIEHLKHGLKPYHILIGGKFSPAFKEFCCTNKISHYDLMENEAFVINNAIATAEGAIMEAIQLSPVNIHNSNCLVLGFGRCGSVLADRLSNLHGKLSILVRRESQAAIVAACGYNYFYENELKQKVSESDFIFNTIPSLILDKNTLSFVNKNAVIIDIASAPGGLDYDYAKSEGLKAKLCLGIPGKTAPLSSARYIYENVERIVKGRTDIF